MSKHMSDRKPDGTPDIMPHRTSDRMPDRPSHFFQETRHSGDHTKQCIFIGNCHGCICISARPLFKFPFAILNSRGMSGMLKELLRSCKSPCAGPPENSLWQTSRELGVFELRPRNRSTAAQSFRSARTTKTTRASSNCANNRGPNLDKSI